MNFGAARTRRAGNSLACRYRLRTSNATWGPFARSMTDPAHTLKAHQCTVSVALVFVAGKPKAAGARPGPTNEIAGSAMPGQIFAPALMPGGSEIQPVFAPGMPGGSGVPGGVTVYSDPSHPLLPQKRHPHQRWVTPLLCSPGPVRIPYRDIPGNVLQA